MISHEETALTVFSANDIIIKRIYAISCSYITYYPLHINKLISCIWLPLPPFWVSHWNHHISSWNNYWFSSSFTNFFIQPCDQRLPAQPVSAQKVQSRKKKAQSYNAVLWASSEFLKKMCLSCLIMIKCCYISEYRINKPITGFCCLICVSCSIHVFLTYYICKGLYKVGKFLLKLITNSWS